MKFIDQTEIDVRSGDGGDGLVSFRAAKYQPKAGLDGGDGGFGGGVYLLGNAQLTSLNSSPISVLLDFQMPVNRPCLALSARQPLKSLIIPLQP